jgi:hypothetical protein
MLLAAVGAGKFAWNGYKGAKAIITTVKKYRHAPSEMDFTFQLCSCLLDALPVGEALAARHLSLRHVGTAVLLARSAIQECRALIDSSVDDTEDGWKEWMRTGQKFEQLKEVQSRLTMAISALQLALSAVTASTLPLRFATSPFAYVPDAIEVAHQSLLQMEMRRTRSIVLSGGELWQRGLPSASARGGGRASAARAATSDAMKLLFSTRVRLHRGSRKGGEEAADDDSDDDDDDDDSDEEGAAPTAAGGGGKRGSAAAATAAKTPTPDKERSDALCLWFIATGSADDDDDDGSDDEGGGERERVLHLDETVRFRRVWSEELAAELKGDHGADFLEMVGAEVLCYEFQPSTLPNPSASPGTSALPLVLTFQMEASHRGGTTRYSAESFEALLFLALCTRTAGKTAASGSRSKPLASAFDPSNPAPFVAAMAANVGPLEGAPSAPASTRKGRASRADADLLTTPLRGLNIS